MTREDAREVDLFLAQVATQGFPIRLSPGGKTVRVNEQHLLPVERSFYYDRKTHLVERLTRPKLSYLAAAWLMAMRLAEIARRRWKAMESPQHPGHVHRLTANDEYAAWSLLSQRLARRLSAHEQAWRELRQLADPEGPRWQPENHLAQRVEASFSHKSPPAVSQLLRDGLEEWTAEPWTPSASELLICAAEWLRGPHHLGTSVAPTAHLEEGTI